MEISEKEIYKALKYYMSHNRDYIDKQFARLLKGKSIKTKITRTTKTNLSCCFIYFNLALFKINFICLHYQLT